MIDFFELFLSLIKKFLIGEIAPAIFKAEYMKLWRECRDVGALEHLNARTEGAFDRIFSACDSYCEDPALRDPIDLDDLQFIQEVDVIARDVLR
jgi:hypothetical protein